MIVALGDAQAFLGMTAYTLVLSMHILAAQSDVRAYVHTCNQYRHAHFRRIQATYYEQEKTFLNDMFMCTSLYITGSQTSPTLYVLDVIDVSICNYMHINMYR